MKKNNRSHRLNYQFLIAALALSSAASFGLALTLNKKEIDPEKALALQDSQVSLLNDADQKQNRDNFLRHSVGKYQDINSSFLAVSDFKESIVDLAYVTINNTQYAFVLTGFAHGEEITDNGASLKKQKLRTFKLGNDAIWQEINNNGKDLDDSVSFFKNEFITEDSGKKITTAKRFYKVTLKKNAQDVGGEHSYKKGTTATVPYKDYIQVNNGDTLEFKLKKSLAIPVNNFTNLHYDKDKKNLILYGINGRTKIFKFNSSSNSFTEDDNAKDLFSLEKLVSVEDSGLGIDSAKFKQLKSSVPRALAKDISKILAVKNVLVLDNKYYFSGEGELVVVYDPVEKKISQVTIGSLNRSQASSSAASAASASSASSSPSSSTSTSTSTALDSEESTIKRTASKGSSEILEKLKDFSNWQSTYTDENWHSRYFLEYTDYLSYSINGIIDASDNKLIYYGGHSSKDANIRNESVISIHLKGSSSSSSNNVKVLGNTGAIKYGIKVSDGYVFATQSAIYKLDKNFNTVKRTTDLQDLKTAGPNGVAAITKLLSDGKGGISVLVSSSDFQKTDLSNAYIGYQDGSVRSVFNNGILISQKYLAYSASNNPYTGKVIVVGGSLNEHANGVFTFKSVLNQDHNVTTPTTDNGNPLLFIKSSILNFNKNLELTNLASNFGNSAYQMALTSNGTVNIPNGISDLYNDGEGGFISSHVDGTLRRLNALGYQTAFANTSGFSKRASATKISAQERQEMLDSKEIIASFSDDHHEIFVSKNKVYFLNDNGKTLSEARNGRALSTVSFSNTSEIELKAVSANYYLLFDKAAQSKKVYALKFTNNRSLAVAQITGSGGFTNIIDLAIGPGSVDGKFVIYYAEKKTSSTNYNDRESGNWKPQAAVLNTNNSQLLSKINLSTSGPYFNGDGTGSNEITYWQTSALRDTNVLDIVIDPVLGNPVFITQTDKTRFNNFHPNQDSSNLRLSFVTYANVFSKLMIKKEQTNLGLSATKIGPYFAYQNNIFVSGNIRKFFPIRSKVPDNNTKLTTTEEDKAHTLIFKDTPLEIDNSFRRNQGLVNSLLVAKGKKIVRVEFGPPIHRNNVIFVNDPASDLNDYLTTKGYFNSVRYHDPTVAGKYGLPINALNTSTVASQKLAFTIPENIKFLIPKIKHLIADGKGGVYIASDKALARLIYNTNTKQFSVLQTFSMEGIFQRENASTKIKSITLDANGMLIVNASDGKSAYLNASFAKGYTQAVENDPTKPLYGDGIIDQKLTEEQLASYQGLVLDNKIYSLDGTTNSSGTDAAAFDKELVNYPSDIEKALQAIRISSAKINNRTEIKIDVDGFYKYDFPQFSKDQNNRSKIKDYFDDIDIEFSYDGLVDNSDHKLWIASSSTKASTELFTQLINPHTSSSVKALQGFALDKIEVRVVKKRNKAPNKLFPITLSKKIVKVKDHSEMLANRPSQIVSIFKGESKFKVSQDFWKNTTSDPNTRDDDIFILDKKDQAQPLTNQNIKIMPPRSLASSALFSGDNAPLEVRYQTNSEAQLSEWKLGKDIDQLQIQTSERTKKVYYKIFIKEKFRQSNTSSNRSDFALIFENTSDTVADDNQNYASVAITFANFNIPIDLSGAKASNWKVSGFSGVPNTDLSEFSAQAFTFSAALKENAEIKDSLKDNVVLHYALSNQDIADGVLTADNEVNLLRSKTGNTFFTKENLIKFLKTDTRLKRDFSLSTKIYARAAFSNLVTNKEKFYLNQEVVKVYDGTNGATNDQSKFKLFVDSQRYFDLLKNTAPANREVITKIRFAGTNNSAFTLDTSRASNFSFSEFSQNFEFSFSESSDGTFKKIDTVNQSFSSNTQKAFLKIIPKDNRVTQNAHQAATEVTLNVKTVISDLSLEKLIAGISVSGNSRNLAITENEAARKSTIAGLKTVSDFERNVDIKYSIQGTNSEPLSKEAFITFLKERKTDELNSIDTEKIHVTYVLTPQGNDKYALPTGQNFITGKKIDNIKKYYSVKKLITEEAINDNFDLSGTVKELSISPKGAFSLENQATHKFQISYGYWKLDKTNNIATYTFSTSPPRQIYLGPLDNLNLKLQEKENETSKSLTSAEATKYHRLSFRLSSTNENVVLGREADNSTDDTFPTKYGFVIDHTRITQIIDVDNNDLVKDLSLSGNVLNLNNDQSRSEFEAKALAKITDTALRNRVQIEYSIGEAIGEKEFFTYDEFKQALKNFNAGSSGPLLLSRTNIAGSASNPKYKQIKARYNLATGTDSRLFVIKEQTNNVVNLNQDKLKVPINLDLLVSALQNKNQQSPTLVTGRDSSSITSIKLPFPSALASKYGNLKAYLDELKSLYNLKLEYNAPHGPKPNQFVEDSSLITNIGEENKIKVRFNFEPDLKDFFDISANNLAPDSQTKLITIEIPVKIPTAIEVNVNLLKTLSFSGNTKNIVIPSLANIKNNIGENKDKVLVEFAIGSSLSALKPLDGSNLWYQGEAFKNQLSSFSEAIPLDAKKLFARYRLKDNVDPQDFVISDPQEVEINSEIQAYLDIRKYISELKSLPLDFADNATSAQPGTPVLPFSDQRTNAILESSGVILEFSNDGTNFTRTFPDSLGNPPLAFARFRADNPQKTVISDPASASGSTSSNISLNLANLRIELDLSTSSLINNIKLSGTTRDIIINERQAQASNPFAFQKAEIVYSFTSNKNNPNLSVHLDPALPSKIWFNAQELKAALKTYKENLYLKRNNEELSILTFSIQMRLRIKDDIEEETQFIFKDNSIQSFEINQLSNLKSEINTDYFVELLKNNIPGRRITFGNSQSDTQIVEVNFESLPISEADKNNLKAAGVILKYKANSESVSGDNVHSWFDDISKKALALHSLGANAPLSQATAARKLALKFEISESHNNFVTINNDETVLKSGADIVVPKILETDGKLLAKIRITGTNQNLTIDDTEARNAIRGTNFSQVEIQYALGPSNNLLALQANSAKTWYSKDEFKRLLEAHQPNIQAQHFIISSRYAISNLAALDLVNVSDPKPRAVNLENFKFIIDLEKEKQISSNSIETSFLELPSLAANFPNALNNLDLGDYLNPFNSQSLKLLDDWGLELKFSLSQNRQNPLESPPKSIQGLPPKLFYWFDIRQNSKVELKAASAKVQNLVVPGPYIISLDTASILKQFSYSGNSSDLVIDTSSFGTIDGSENSFLKAEIEPRFALKDVNFNASLIDSVVDEEQTYFTKEKFLELLKAYDRDLVGPNKVIYTKLFPKVLSANESVKITNSKAAENDFIEADLSEVKSYIHLQKALKTLKSELSSAGENDSNTNITSLVLAIDQNSETYLKNLGIKFEYSNQKAEIDAQGKISIPEAAWSSILPTSLVENEQFLYFRFRLSDNNPNNLFISEANLEAIKLPVAVRRSISVLVDNLRLINLSGTTKDLVITNEENALAPISDLDRNAIEIEFAIGAIGEEIELKAGKIWYSKEKFIEALKSYPQTIYNKLIQARYNVNKENDSQARPSTRASIILEDNNINNLSKVKVFVRESVETLDLASEIKISGISTNVIVNSEAITKVLPRGLRVEYSNLDGISINSPNWTVTPPATLSASRQLYAKIAPSEGYAFSQSDLVRLNTNQVRDNVIVHDRLSAIRLSGNTFNLEIDESAALAGISESAHSTNLVIKYSVGEEINGALWLPKDEFISALQSLKGILPSSQILLRERIKARYDFNNPDLNDFVFTINGIEISQDNINNTETEQFQLQLVANNLNNDLKGYLNTEVFKNLNLENLSLAGTAKDPNLILNDRILEFFRFYNDSEAFSIFFSGTRKNQEQANFGRQLRLFPALNSNIYINSLNLSSLSSNLNQGFSLNAKDLFFALRFQNAPAYVIGDNEGNLLANYDFVFAEDKLKVLIGIEASFASEPTLNLVSSEPQSSRLVQGHTSVAISNKQTLDPHLAYFYHVDRRLLSSANLQNVVNDPLQWVTEAPLNLRVGDHVYVKIDVKDPEHFILNEPSNYFTTNPLKVKDLYIDPQKLEIATDLIKFSSAISEKNQAFDGLSLISQVALKDLDGHQYGVDLVLISRLDYILDSSGRIQVDRFGVPIVRRQGKQTTKAIILTNGSQAQDAQGNKLFYYEENGYPGKPLNTGEINEITLLTLNGTEDEFIFKEDNISQDLKKYLFNNQDLTFKFKLREGYKVTNKEELENLRINFRTEGLLYEIINDRSFELLRIKESEDTFIKTREQDQRPINGFASLNDNSLEGQISTNGKLKTISSIRQLAESLLTIDSTLRLELKVLSNDNNLSQTYLLYPEGLSGPTNLPLNLANDEALTISVVSTDKKRGFNARSVQIGVKGLFTEPPLEGLKYLRIKFDGEFNHEAAFQLITTNPATSEQPLASVYVFEYALNGGVYSREFPHKLKNGDRITWRLISTNSNIVLENDFANRLPLSLGSTEFMIHNDDGEAGFLVSGLKERFQIPANFNLEDLNKISFTYEGNNRVANHTLHLNGIKIPKGLEVQVFNLTQNRIMDGAADRLQNGDQLQLRLSLNNDLIRLGFVLSDDLRSSTTEVQGLIEEKAPLLNSQASVFVVIGSILGVLGLGGLAYFVIKRRRLK